MAKGFLERFCQLATFKSHLRFVKKLYSYEYKIVGGENFDSEGVLAEFFIRALPAGEYGHIGDVLEFDFSYHIGGDILHKQIFLSIGDSFSIGDKIEEVFNIIVSRPKFHGLKIGDPTGVFFRGNEFRLVFEGREITPVLSRGDGNFPFQQFISSETGQILSSSSLTGAYDIIQEVLRQLEESKE